MDPSCPAHSAAATAAAVTVRDDVGIAAIGAREWDALGGGAPLISHAFLSALHQSGCASPATGWSPRYLTAWRGPMLVGALPLYAKTHSYGEYVFDWAWADAYRRHGRRYYPKLLVAIPFTPAPGPRLLGTDDEARARADRRGTGAASTRALDTRRRSRRCTCSFRRRKKRAPGRRPASCSAMVCSSAGRTAATPTSPSSCRRSTTTSARR